MTFIIDVNGGLGESWRSPCIFPSLLIELSARDKSLFVQLLILLVEVRGIHLQARETDEDPSTNTQRQVNTPSTTQNAKKQGENNEAQKDQSTNVVLCFSVGHGNRHHRNGGTT